MLQILLKSNDKYSLAEMGQMAAEGGAGWLVLDLEDVAVEAIREELDELVALCRDGGVLLTIVNRADLARDLGVHGVYLTAGAASPIAVREELGPEAIVGAAVASAESAATMARADIDYVTLDAANANAAEICAQLKQIGCEIPVVAFAPDMLVNAENVQQLLAKGYAGICGGVSLFNAPDPVKAVEIALQLFA